MPKYYCEYCDIFLTHDSPSVRKAHNAGKNHIANVRIYYSELGQDKTQNVIDSILKSHEGGYPPPFAFQGALAPQPPPQMGFPGGPPPNFFGPPPTGPPPAGFYGPPPSGPPPLPGTFGSGTTGHPSFPNATMTGPPPQGPPSLGQPPGQPPYYQPPQLMNGPPPSGPPPSGPPLDGPYPMQH